MKGKNEILSEILNAVKEARRQKLARDFLSQNGRGEFEIDLDNFLDEEFSLYLKTTGDPVKAFKALRELRFDPLEQQNNALIADLKNLIEVTKKYKIRGQGRKRKQESDSIEERLIVHDFLQSNRFKENGWSAFKHYCERKQSLDYTIPFEKTKFYDLKKEILNKPSA